MNTAPLLRVEKQRVHLPIRTGGLLRPRTAALKAVDGISFDLAAGETLAVVGESGCGKSTLGRVLPRRIAPTWGRVLRRGGDLAVRAMGRRRRDLQILLQDPIAAPRMHRRTPA